MAARDEGAAPAAGERSTVPRPALLREPQDGDLPPSEDGGPPPTQAASDVPAAPAARRGRLFYGWWIVGAAALINGSGGALQWQGFTVLFLPVSESLGLGLGATALAFSLARAENGVIGPISGWLIDRYGVRPLMFGGTLVVGVGYIVLARANTFPMFLLIYVLVISIGASTAFMQGTTAALNQWFVRRRGLVMGISSAAFRMGGAVMIPVLSVIVLRYGWQTASIWIGVLMLVWVAPLALFFRRSPEEMGLRPDGDPPEAEPVAVQVAGGDPEGDWGVKEALRTRAFWVLVAGTMLRMSAHGAVFVHMIPILVWKGIDQQVAANMLGGLALVSVPLILVGGWLGDRIGRRQLVAGAYTVSAASLLLLTVAHGAVPVFGALLLFSASEAASALNWALVGDLFGRRNFATIRGMMAPMYNLSLVVTPVAAGLVFDATGSYRVVLYVGAGLMLSATMVFLRLRPPKRSRVGS